MSSLIINTPPMVRTTPAAEPEPAGSLSAGAFWPVVDLFKLRQAVAIEGSVTLERLSHAAEAALAFVIDQLSNWAAQQQKLGYTTLASVPTVSINERSINLIRFERAVYAYCKANLIERYADSNATGRADRDQDGRRNEAEEYRRDALWALRDIASVQRMTSELI